MDKYRRVQKQRPSEHPEDIQESEIRVTSKRSPRSYITYAVGTLENKEKEINQVVFKAMGKAISTAVHVVESVKRRVEGLHQITQFESTQIIDEYEPIVQGLDKKEISRNVSTITITLSKAPLDTKNPGYQAPLPDEVVKAEKEAFEKKKEQDKVNQEERDAKRAEREKEREKRGEERRGRGEGRGELRERAPRRGRGEGRGDGRRDGRDARDDRRGGGRDTRDDRRGGGRGGRGGGRYNEGSRYEDRDSGRGGSGGGRRGSGGRGRYTRDERDDRDYYDGGYERRGRGGYGGGRGGSGGSGRPRSNGRGGGRGRSDY